MGHGNFLSGWGWIDKITFFKRMGWIDRVIF